MRSIKEKILEELEGKVTCPLCNAPTTYNYSLGKLVRWKGSDGKDDDLSGQAKILLLWEFKPTDRFCPDCFWK